MTRDKQDHFVILPYCVFLFITPLPRVTCNFLSLSLLLNTLHSFSLLFACTFGSTLLTYRERKREIETERDMERTDQQGRGFQEYQRIPQPQQMIPSSGNYTYKLLHFLPTLFIISLFFFWANKMLTQTHTCVCSMCIFSWVYVCERLILQVEMLQLEDLIRLYVNCMSLYICVIIDLISSRGRSACNCIASFLLSCLSLIL